MRINAQTNIGIAMIKPLAVVISAPPMVPDSIDASTPAGLAAIAINAPIIP